MPHRNVSLTDHFVEFIDASIESGRFSDASEIVREGLRLLEQREREGEAKIAWLSAAAADAFGALDRGEGLRFESMNELDTYIMDIGDDVFGETVMPPL